MIRLLLLFLGAPAIKIGIYGELAASRKVSGSRESHGGDLAGQSALLTSRRMHPAETFPVVSIFVQLALDRLY
jgi:hypothetical protein